MAGEVSIRALWRISWLLEGLPRQSSPDEDLMAIHLQTFTLFKHNICHIYILTLVIF